MYKLKIIILSCICILFYTSAFASLDTNKTYNKIVVIDPAVVENIYALNAEDKIVAVAHSQSSGIQPNEKTKLLPSVGTILKPSLEKILYFKPDLVVLGYSDNTLANKLKSLNIPTIKLDTNSIEDIFSNLTQIAKIVKKEPKAQALIKQYRNKLKIIEKNKLTNIKGGFLYSAKPLMVFGPGTLPFEIIQLYGATNITTDQAFITGKQPIISPELLLQENPDFLVAIAGIKSMDDLLVSIPVIKSINAYKDQHIIILDSYKILRGSIYLVDEIIKVHTKIDDIINENQS